jgi:hypothetical protein
MAKYLRYAGHGGHCCGIIHLHSFNDVANIQTGTQETSWGGTYPLWKPRTLEQQKEIIVASILRAQKEHYTNVWNRSQRMKEVEKPQDWGCLVECTLAGAQVVKWDQALTELGFKAVTSFVNSNSSNKVTVYHLYTKDLKTDA